MGVFTFSQENISAVALATLYKALVSDGDSLIPKAVDAIQSVNHQEDQLPPRVEAVDKDNLVYNYTSVESDTFLETLEKIAVETSLAVAAPGGGSVMKVTVHYVIKGDAKPSEEELKIGKRKGEGLSRLKLSD